MARDLARDHGVIRCRISVAPIRPHLGADDVDVRLEAMLGLRPAGRLDHSKRGPIYHAVRVHHERDRHSEPALGRSDFGWSRHPEPELSHEAASRRAADPEVAMI